MVELNERISLFILHLIGKQKLFSLMKLQKTINEMIIGANASLTARDRIHLPRCMSHGHGHEIRKQMDSKRFCSCTMLHPFSRSANTATIKMGNVNRKLDLNHCFTRNSIDFYNFFSPFRLASFAEWSEQTTFCGGYRIGRCASCTMCRIPSKWTRLFGWLQFENIPHMWISIIVRDQVREPKHHTSSTKFLQRKMSHGLKEAESKTRNNFTPTSADPHSLERTRYLNSDFSQFFESFFWCFRIHLSVSSPAQLCPQIYS